MQKLYIYKLLYTTILTIVLTMGFSFTAFASSAIIDKTSYAVDEDIYYTANNTGEGFRYIRVIDTSDDSLHCQLDQTQSNSYMGGGSFDNDYGANLQTYCNFTAGEYQVELHDIYDPFTTEIGTEKVFTVGTTEEPPPVTDFSYTDNFDSYTVGDLNTQGSWKYLDDVGSTPVLSVSTTSSQTSPNSAKRENGLRYFGLMIGTSTDVYIKFDITHDISESTNTENLYRIGRSDGGTSFVSSTQDMQIKVNGEIFLGETVMGQLEQGWNTVEIRVSGETGTWCQNLRINGGTQSIDYCVNSATTTTNYINSFTIGGGGWVTRYIDNFEVHTNANVPEITTPVEDLSTRIIGVAPANGSTTPSTLVDLSVLAYYNDTTHPDYDSIVFRLTASENQYLYEPLVLPLTSSGSQTLSTTTRLVTGYHILQTSFYDSTSDTYFDTLTTSFIVATTTAGYTPVPTLDDELDVDCSLLDSWHEKLLCGIGKLFSKTITYLFVPSSTVTGQVAMTIDTAKTRLPFSFLAELQQVVDDIDQEIGEAPELNVTFSPKRANAETALFSVTLLSEETITDIMPPSLLALLRNLMTMALYLGLLIMIVGSIMRLIKVRA